jgi:hypothetical protein
MVEGASGILAISPYPERPPYEPRTIAFYPSIWRAPFGGIRQHEHVQAGEQH